MEPRTFGDNLRRLRTQKGMTQEKLMDALGLKRPAPISLWEKKGKLPKPETIARIAQALGCLTSDLLAGVETPYDLLRRNEFRTGAKARAPSEPRPVRNVRASSA